MALVTLLHIGLEGQEAASALQWPPGQPHGGGLAQTPLSSHRPPASIPSPTSLGVSLESGDTASGPGLDGLSDTELDRGSPPFS